MTPAEITPDLPVSESPEAPPVAAPATPMVAPVSATERISSMDVVRGFALLGILAMNIVGFAFHPSVYGDPTVAGGSTGINLWVYVFNSVMVDGKMRGIFSLMFGAGVLLLTSRAEQRGAGALGADIHYRRMLWMILFGVVHAFVLWWGEILYPYALLGLMLYPFRRLSVRALLIFAVVLMLGTTGFSVGMAYGLRGKRDAAAKADAAAAQGAKLTEEQTKAQKEWKDTLKEMKPDAAELKKTAEPFRGFLQLGGGFVSAIKARAPVVMRWHSMPYYSPMMWDLLCMMLLGMALLKAGVLSGERSFGFYRKLALIGLTIGIPLHIYGVSNMVRVNFDLIPTVFYWIPYQPARIAVCLAYVSILVMMVKAGALRWLTSSLGAVGQMALTNYIMHSVICTTFFCVLGYFGKLERHQIYYVVGSIWLFQMITSPIWLRHFRFGPMEWVWRSLTYWKRQPMRI